MWRRAEAKILNGRAQASAAVVGLATALTLAGCGLKLPVATNSSASTTTGAPASPIKQTVTRASTGKSRTTTATRTTVVRAATGVNTENTVRTATAAAAVRAFATAYINWNAQDFASLLERLGNSSTGQAQETMLLDAAEVARDSSLRSDGISNSGTVETVAPVVGAGGARYLIVTREQTTSTKSNAYTGVGPSWHVTLATVAQVGGRWVVSSWQPQS